MRNGWTKEMKNSTGKTSGQNERSTILILWKLQVLWNKNPELRLGQLINILTKDKDLFYLEDEKLYNRIKKAIEKGL